ncbi:MAG: porin family protein [Proteobacteria bacterium]|nr:porin family protein [Pseudomonadota bacterium]
MKNSVRALFFIAAFTLAPALQAEEPKYNYYIGAGYSHIVAEYNNTNLFEDSFPGGEIYGGYQFHKNAALELGGFFTGDEDKQTGAVSTSFQLAGFYVGLLGILPVYERVNLLGDVGYMFMSKDIEASSGTSTASVDDVQDAFRVGAGAEFMMTDQVGLRGMVHYIYDNSDAIDYLMQYSASVVYHF